MKKRKLILNTLLLGALLGSPEMVEAQSAFEYRTKEYQAIGDNVLNLINASEAYEEGYTGKGIIVGVCDSPTNFAHPDFSKKTKSGMINIVGDGNYNWQAMGHGTVVSGIIAADKDDEGMHGVAFDADIKAVAVGKKYTDTGAWSKPRRDIYKYYIEHPEIKVINNSWGSELYMTDIFHEVKYNIVDEKLKRDNAYKASVEAVAKDKLLIFSSGNSGQTTPCLENVMGIFNPKLKNNIVSVSASNASSFFRNSDDSLDIDSSSMAIFSNLARYNEDSTISAPGVDISTTNANFEKDGMDYVEESGTSMASPVVTGVGALVQQAFPYLGGKQIGDVLLSTANNKLNNPEGFFFTWQVEDDEAKESFPYTLNFYFLNNEAGQKASEKTNEDLFKFYYESNDLGILYRLDLVGKGSAIDWLENMEKAGCIKRHENVPMDMIFGQGIVDAYKAVQGLGAINVRRLNKDDVTDDYTVMGKNETQALYTVDTKGYDSRWSNDIKEIRAGNIAKYPLGENNLDFDGKDADIKDLRERWEFYSNNWKENPIELYISKRYISQYNEEMKKNGLLGIHAGLLKKGKGVLHLSGQNQYKGSTVIKEGFLDIDGSVAGDVHVDEKGTLMGTGVIGNNVYNNGTILGGTLERIGTLTVKGDLSGEGKIIVNGNGYDVSKIVVENNVDISKMKVIFKGILRPDMENCIFIETKKGSTNEDYDVIRRSMKSISKKAMNNKIDDDDMFDQVDYHSSGLMNIKMMTKDNKITMSTEFANKTGVHEDVFSALSNMYKMSDIDDKTKMSKVFSLDKIKATEALNQMADGINLDMAYDVVSHNEIKTAVDAQVDLARLNGIWAMNNRYWQDSAGIKSSGFGFTIGKDLISKDNMKIGAVFNYSKNKVTADTNSGQYDNYQVGIYGQRELGANQLSSYVSFGKQKNKYNKKLSAIDEQLAAKYDSNTIGLGIKYAHSLEAKRDNKWLPKVYGKIDYNRYMQKSFNEEGESLYKQKHKAFDVDYLTGEIGMEYKMQKEKQAFSANIGYKRVLKGTVLSENTAFVKDKDSQNAMQLKSKERAKDYIVLGGSVEQNLSEKWSVTGLLNQELAKNHSNLRANIGFNYQF